MRKGKKTVGIFLVLAMILSMSLPGLVFAEGEYSITVENAAAGETYCAYKIFDATYSGDNAVYYIHTSDAYYEDVAGSSLFKLIPAGENTFQVSWEEKDRDNIPPFFSGIGYKGEPVGSATAEDTGSGKITAVISVPSPGYYFVTTTLGSVISITSAAPEGIIREKNTVPVLDKGVRDESHEGPGGNEKDFEENNQADIGDLLEFELTISQAAHLSSLILHDYMDPGLSFSGNESIKVYLGSISDGNAVSSGNYTIKNESGCHDGCAFQIEFNRDWLDSLAVTDIIIVTYTAVVNENAVTDNWNHAVIKYGDGGTSIPADTDTQVFGFELKKTDDKGEKLDGAVFTLTEISKASGFLENVKMDELLYFVKNAEGKYILAENGKEEVGASEKIEVGSAILFGLEAGTYKLTELIAPDGYNLLTGDITVTIDKDGTVTFSGGDGGSSAGNILTVVNYAGSPLPGTGGIGTTIFYVLGVLLILGAGSVLVLKRQRKGTR